MAFAAMKHWRSLMTATAGKRQFASSTAPRFAQVSANSTASNQPAKKSWYSSGDAAPILLLAGFTTVVVLMAVHTAKNQLIHFPSITVKKEKRKNLAEVEDPKNAVSNADKFVNKSFLRKVGQIQDPDTRVLKDPTRPDPFTMPRNYESLESAGVRK